MKKILFASTFACCLIPQANAAVINFDDQATGTIIDTEYAPVVSLRVKNRGGGPDLGVIFDTLNPTGGDIDLGGPFDSNNPKLADNFKTGNVLIIQENRMGCDTAICTNPDDEGSRPAGTFYFDFETVITLESIDFFDVETAENGRTPNNAIKLFDAADNEIMPDTFYTPDTGGDNMWDQLVFDVDGVKRIELNLGGSGAIDNIRFTVVPIPPAIWLFGSGLIGLVGLARRKN
jgi:hypothetical protein